ncbi:hypothetical protein AOXY_G32546 [Acipenser oxyrinchus oxyrinchus]|uniref:Uncharacterized protein n=1 Tax=Acipenser oxyrinchus oxyrinchus TaxID=40147 RepID=A0AAD8CHX4_ACIOX|nr:hypothetical protein AOXY_G32546 [Acipenser oxyrinchus oxyrinchus]
MASEVEKAIQGLESSTAELGGELQRLEANMRKLSDFQRSLLRVNSQLCSWMTNVNEMSKQRRESRSQPPCSRETDAQ